MARNKEIEGKFAYRDPRSPAQYYPQIHGPKCLPFSLIYAIVLLMGQQYVEKGVTVFTRYSKSPHLHAWLTEPGV